MVAALQPKMPERPAYRAEDFWSLVRGSGGEFDVAKSREGIAKLMRELDANNAEYAGILHRTIDGVISVLKVNSSVDVQSTIDKLAQFEEEQKSLHDQVEKQAGRDLKWLAKNRPHALQLMNETLATFLKRVDHLSEVYRDLRWKLMKARAEYAPSAGKGAIHGSATDLDALAKTHP